MYSKNSTICTKINRSDSKKKSAKFHKLKELIESIEFKEEMNWVSSLWPIIEIIKNLQIRGLTLSEQINYVNEVSYELSSLLDNSKSIKIIRAVKFYTELIDKYNQVIDKNTGFKKLRHQLSNNTLPKEFQFTQITSAEIERTFNILHIMVNERRINLSDKNVEAMLVIHHEIYLNN